MLKTVKPFQSLKSSGFWEFYKYLKLSNSKLTKKEVIKVVKFIVIIIYTIMAAFLALYNIYLESLSQRVENCHAEASVSSFRTSFFNIPLFIFFLNFQRQKVLSKGRKFTNCRVLLQSMLN